MPKLHEAVANAVADADQAVAAALARAFLAVGGYRSWHCATVDHWLVAVLILPVIPENDVPAEVYS